MEELRECCCSGLRYCQKCLDTERVRKIKMGDVELRSPGDVILNQFTETRTSSCSFLKLMPVSLNFCPECGNVFDSGCLLENCSDHTSFFPSKVQIDGFFIMRDGVTEEEEKLLVENFDKNMVWKQSQSGRCKIEYGPKRNFKKKKVKLPDTPGMPKALEHLFTHISQFAAKNTRRDFQIAEVSILDYLEDRLSSFDPHVDDTWLWGGRVVGVNLLSSVVFSLVNSEGVGVNAVLPRRCFFMMSGKSRYEWMHGIHPCHIRGRRVSITFRELSDEIILQRPEICESILNAAKTFV